MFQSISSAPWSFQYPWKLSFQDRLAALCARKRRVAYFYENPDTSTFRYRVFNMVEALNSDHNLDISASWFSLADTERMNRFIDQADVLVICRARYGAAVEQILTRAKARRIPILFDVDDLVFDGGYVPLIIDSLDQPRTSDNWDNWFAWSGRYGATLRCCDGAITTNQFLADKIEAFMPGMTPHIVPNFLNRIQQEKSSAIWDDKVKSNFQRDDRIHIGYFSGSPTHNHDFEVANCGLAAIMDRFPDTILRIVGFLEPKPPLSLHKERIEMFPLQDFLNLQRLIGEVEVNVAPLQNNLFTNCKSELKYFEAAAVGTLTIATPTFTFRNSIIDGKNGFLSASHEWESKLNLALAAVNEPDQYSDIVRCAQQQAVQSYGWDRFANRIEAAVFGEKDNSRSYNTVYV